MGSLLGIESVQQGVIGSGEVDSIEYALSLQWVTRITPQQELEADHQSAMEQ